MNQALKQKRDELAHQHEAECWRMSSYVESTDESSFKHGFDAAIAAVIELVVEFDEKALWDFSQQPTKSSWTFSMMDQAARWQHSEILKKVKGEKNDVSNT